MNKSTTQSQMYLLITGAVAFMLSGCGGLESKIASKENTDKTESLMSCTDNAVTAGPCEVGSAGKIVTGTFGSDVTVWTNITGSTSVRAPIPNAFYANQDVIFTDANLLATNIVNGVSIFGVTGTATGPYPACADNALNASACSTSANRYITATSGNDVTGWSNGTSSTTVSASIPDAFYSSKSCQFTDADLVAGNIKSGTNIFGVLGTVTEAYATCADDALNTSQCSAATNRYVTATSGNNITGNNGSLSTNIPTGFYTGRTCTMSDTNLIANNIRKNVNIFGVNGTYVGTFYENTASSAYRDPGSIPVPMNLDNQTTSGQISLKEEVTDFSGNDLPTTGGCSYREIPDPRKDDEGASGLTCKYAPRPTVDCGISQASIELRIANCAAANPTASTWNGATECNGPEDLLKLVARDGANKEVWRDEKTKLLWSSFVSAGANWCQFTGNTQTTQISYQKSFNDTLSTPIIGNGTVGNIFGGPSSPQTIVVIAFSSATTFAVNPAGSGCADGAITAGGLTTTPGSTVTWSRPGVCSFTITQGSINFANKDVIYLQSANGGSSCTPGSSLQPANPIRFCAEAPGLNPPAGENWSAGTYMAAKGRLGRKSTPSVAWRAPTMNDFMQANLNGIRFVMPDMGVAGNSRPSRDNSSSGILEWSASSYSLYVGSAWAFNGRDGLDNSNMNRNLTNRIRCVGR